ncbi:MAG: phospholipase D-like domain-containing protein [Thermodesulfovibrionales bacterium]|nr:phospholipase D-like domain-containing protein [Thermodesulfovibrionales bacterium]
MPYSDIIDNRNVKLRDEINSILGSSERVKFAVGYLYLSGFYQIAEKLGELSEVKILTGDSLNRETIEELAQSLASVDELEDVYNSKKIQKKSEKERVKTEVADAIVKNLEALPHSIERESNIKRLSELIRAGRVQVKVYTKHPLHAKAYIFKYKKEGADAARAEGISIVGSSNLTISGFHHNTELNTYVRGQNNYEELNKWFDELWAEAAPFEDVLAGQLEESWALKTVNPYDIYILTLYHLVKNNLEKQAATIWNWEKMPELYSFQKAAIMQAYQILNKYNGVFISDVVGIGKTFIGAGLLRHLKKRALIISPPGLIEMWKEFKERFEIDAEVISRGMFYRGIYDSDSVLKQYESREVILIDESHHFRNTKARRYQELQPFLADKQVILMTATPQNTSVWNIYNQIKLFHQTEENIFPIDGENHLRNLFKKAEEGSFHIKELLKHILIRRTRNHIKKFYPTDTEELKFPARKLETLSYDINKTYHHLYENIKTTLRKLTFSRYNLWDYVRDEKKHTLPYSDLEKVITTLKVFHKINLFKRLESSIYAFKMTINNLLGIYQKFYKIIEEKGIVPAGEKAADAIYRHELDDIWDEIEEITRDYKAEDFYIDRLKKDMLSDIYILEEIKKDLEKIPKDDDMKYDMLKDAIDNIKKENSAQKVLIFSEYADTVKYLYERVKDAYPNVDFATSAAGTEIPHKAAYFSPVANSYSGTKRIDVMITTDVLSEGYNLQDCNIVINYDLHWNPVRLIQRAGRIDRIGSEAEVIYIKNFLPVGKIEREINLKRTLKKRIEEIHKYIGEDNKILDESERLNEDAMYCIYEKRDMDEVEKDEDTGFSFDEAENIIKQLKKEKPEYMALIEKMQLGLRSAKEGKKYKGTYAFFKAGDTAKLFMLTPRGETIDDFSEIINELRCEKDCPEKEVGEKQKGNYFDDLNKLRKKFKETIAGENLKLKPHSEVLKTKKRLQQIVDLFSTAEVKGNAEKLDKSLNEFFPHHLIPLLKRLNKGAYSDEQYLNELIDIYNKEKLSEVTGKSQLSQKGKQVEFICGEILV